MKPAWFPDWSADAAGVLVASGESANEADVAKFRGRCRVVVINNSWQLAPWADMLYAADFQWWACDRPGYGLQALRDFPGLKVTQDASVASHHKLPRLTIIDEDKPGGTSLQFDTPGVVGAGGNSAFQAFNAMLQFGLRRVILVGLDLCGGHWHGRHQPFARDPREGTMKRWAQVFDAQAPLLRERGIEVINCSERSTVKAYPKMTVDDALAKLNIRAWAI